MSVQSDLTALGFPVAKIGLAKATANFQGGWNLGTALPVDGQPGPITRAALAISMTRLRAGQPTASANFSFTEFACNCGGRWPDCASIWQKRSNIRGLEALRTLTGPLSVERGCRCPSENKRVGGVSNSQHLYGLASDVTVFKVLIEKVMALRVFSGLGWYVWRDRAYPRHVDNRRERTVTSPAKWNYGNAKSEPLTPNPSGASAPTKVTPPAPTTSTQEDFDMATTQEVVQALLDSPLGANPADPTRPVTFGYSVEIARNYSFRAYMETIQLTGELGGLKAVVDLLVSQEDYTLEDIRKASEEGSRAAIEAKITGAEINLKVEGGA